MENEFLYKSRDFNQTALAEGIKNKHAINLSASDSIFFNIETDVNNMTRPNS